MKTFNGEAEQFLSFFEGFKSLVHNNSRLDDISKFLYLKSVLGPEPSKVIESLDVIALNYQVALHLIEKRYRNNKLLVYSHIKGLIDFPRIPRESAIALRQISDTFQAHIRALESLSEPVKSWSSILTYLISDKLDYNSKKELEIFVSKGDKTPPLSDVVDFLETRAKLLERLDRPIIKSTAQSKFKSSHSYIASVDTNNCILCGTKESIATIPEMIRAFPTIPKFSRIIPILPEHSRRLETPCLTQGIYCDYSWNDPSTPDFSRIFPILSELFRRPETPCLVRGIDCDYSQNDPSPRDFFRRLKPSYEESIATVPEAIRELPNLTTATTFPKSPNE
ncbi:hypothetical protein NQ317_018422 [Molorchus minor]|uniref:Uncharacterized protein n=1 Tax=Molorchus minor TaxID=1323400 RepID=A0ABQ9JML9_9CUCU|nr:hypothetical protein NQ317_018422 [Molorchus minor]